jgi:long-chain acyl-CoA synthetase
VPDFETLRDHLASHNVGATAPEDMIALPEVKRLYDDLLEDLNRNLPGFSQIKKCALLPREFTLENGELTPTMKVKRFAIAEKYRDVISQLYPDTLPGDED